MSSKICSHYHPTKNNCRYGNNCRNIHLIDSKYYAYNHALVRKCPHIYTNMCIIRHCEYFHMDDDVRFYHNYNIDYKSNKVIQSSLQKHLGNNEYNRYVHDILSQFMTSNNMKNKAIIEYIRHLQMTIHNMSPN